MRTLVIGDIHGAYKALEQCLNACAFGTQTDRLIVLGDVVDGWPESVEVIRELAGLKDVVYIIGNHDKWFIDFLTHGKKEYLWVAQGGQATIESYMKHMKSGLAAELMGFFDKGVYYYEQDNKLFVHGGYDWHHPIAQQIPGDLIWDRHLWEAACMWEALPDALVVQDYDEVFIGHTSTCYQFKDMLPHKCSNVWNLDQGAGWEGRLTIMDVDTKQHWQSDIVKDLYPGVKGR